MLQAKSDIETEPLGSLEYAHAVAFFTSGGEWTQMRAIARNAPTARAAAVSRLRWQNAVKKGAIHAMNADGRCRPGRTKTELLRRHGACRPN